MKARNKEKIFDVIVSRAVAVKVIASSQREARAIAEDVTPTEEFADTRNVSRKVGSAKACDQQVIDEMRRSGRNIYTRNFQSKVATIRSIFISAGFNMRNLVVTKTAGVEAYTVKIYEEVEFQRLQQALENTGGKATISEGLDTFLRKKRYLRVTIKFNENIENI